MFQVVSGVLSGGVTLFVVLLAFGVLILAHEAGHYVGARMTGMSVPIFSIGFGPPLLRRWIGDTEFRLAPIPGGGFVRILGQHETDESTEAYIATLESASEVPADRSARWRDKTRWYSHQSGWRQLVVILAGPIASLLMAIPCTYAAISLTPVVLPPLVVETVVAPSPASVAGLQPGDRVVSIDGTTTEDFQLIASALHSHQIAGTPALIGVQRGGDQLRVELSVPPGATQLGFGFERRMVPFADRLVVSLRQSASMVSTIFRGILDALGGRIFGNLQGPVGILTLSFGAAHEGAGRFFLFLAILTANLGVINLLPVPVLDGGHAVFAIWKGITGRELPLTLRYVLLTGGTILVLALALFATGHDLLRLFTGLAG